MKKTISVIGIVVVAVVIWFVVTMDERIRSHIEETATYLAGVPVTIADLEISLVSGTGQISGLTVGNPNGFSKGNAIEMSSIVVELNPGAVFGQPLEINKLEFDSPVVNLEINEENYSNLQEIVSVSNKQNNVQEKSNQSKNSQAKSGGTNEQTGKDNTTDQSQSNNNADEPVEENDDFRMVFRQLNFKNITLNAQRGIDQWSETISEVKLENVGQENGIGTRELGITIVRLLASRALAQAAQRSLTDIVEDKVKELGNKLLESLMNEQN